MNSDSALFHALEEGAVCLSVNKRLARDLMQRYERWQEALGAKVWETPDILPVDAWLVRCWNEQCVLTDAAGRIPTLLSRFAEIEVWESIIAQAEAENPLLRVSQAALTAQEAFALMQAYGLKRREVEQAASEETIAFLAWTERLDRLCDDRNWLVHAQLPDRIHPQVDTHPPLWLAGLSDRSPQLNGLLRRFAQGGCEVREVWEPATRASDIRRLTLLDAERELRCAALWARSLLAHDPKLRIGIVVADLTRLRRRLIHIFDEVLDPASVMNGTSANGRSYNVSLGEPLVDAPLIDAALRLLDLVVRQFTAQAAGLLFRSPFLGESEREATARSMLDLALRDSGRFSWDLASLATDARLSPHSPALSKRLQKILRFPLPKTATPDRWGQLFSDLLEAFGWPGERPLDSTEFQTLSAWGTALGEFARLNIAGLKLDFEDALARLRHVLKETLFQPASIEAPIQVLGWLEAEGSRFDHLWLLGLHDEVLPAPAQPNPLLPISIQRRHDLPRARALHELRYAERRLARLCASADRVIVSHPEREGDRELRASPLIIDQPACSIDALALPEFHPYARRLLATAPLEEVEDRGVPLEQGAAVRGGASALAAQAACPFRGFAERQLGATEMEEPQPGITPALRGQLVHDALARLWGGLKNHATLIAQSADSLKARIGEAVQGSLVELAAEMPWIDSRSLRLERGRLETVLAEWLGLEKTREAFEVIGREQEMRIELGGLAFRLRVDRIDRLPDGSAIVIDYKTGAQLHSLADWHYPRLQSPQLPLYGYRDDAVLAAVAYARLLPGACRFAGDGHGLPDVPSSRLPKNQSPVEDWDARLRRWRSSLEDLAQEIRSGEARIDPHSNRVCQQCALPGLCRIEDESDRDDERLEP